MTDHKKTQRDQDDAERAQTTITSACSEDPGTDDNRKPLVPPGGANCDLAVEPADPKAPTASEDAGRNPGTPVTGTGNTEDDENVAKMEAKYQDPNAQGVQGRQGVSKAEKETEDKKKAQAEEDFKRARTTIKSACGEDPGTDDNRNPLIPPGGANCDLAVEPADPKALMASEDAGRNPGTPVTGTGNAEDDENVAKMEDEGKGPLGQGLSRLKDQVAEGLKAEDRRAQVEARLQELEEKVEPALRQVWGRIKTLTPGIGQERKDAEKPDPEDRYDVDLQALEKIAIKATESVDGILGIHRSLFDDLASRFKEGTSGVHVRIEEEEVIVRLKLVLDYDAERNRVFTDLKTVMKNRIESATGLKLKAIQVTIEDVMTAEDYKKHL